MTSLESFNNNFEKLLKNIINLFPNQKNKIEDNYSFPIEGDSHIKSYFEVCKLISKDISERNEIIFSEEYQIIPNVNFYEIWNDEDIGEDSKDIIWKYLQTLYINSYEYQKNEDVKDILSQLKNINNNEADLDEQTKTFLSIIDDLSGKNKIDTDIINEISDDEDEESASGFTMPNMPDLSNLMNGSIGKLAQEIVSGLDTNKLDMEDPSKLLKNLLSGNIEEDSGLMNLVKDITGKIHDKINSGELNEESLYNEANNVMNTFNSGSKSSNPFNNLFSQAMKNGFQSGLDSDVTEENLDILKNCQNMLNNKKVSSSNPNKLMNNAKLQKRRELMRKKLELKKKLEENKKKLQEQEELYNNTSLEEWNEFQ